ncbi:MAG: hypothetical protein V4649_10585 [Bacteroidota bacterium]
MIESMKGVSFITDETHHKRYVQLDLEEVATINDAQLEDLLDVIIAEARKNDEKITLDELGQQLRDEGLL